MAVVDEQVAASADDASQLDAGAAAWADIYLYVHATFSPLTRYHTGLLFSPNIPQAATILAAKLIVYVYAPFPGMQDDPNLRIYGNDVDSAVDFNIPNNDIVGRTYTTAGVDWIDTNLPHGWNDSPDITPVVQEIVDRPLWVANNNMCFLLIAWGFPVAQLCIYAEDYSTGLLAAKLHIEYKVHYGFTNFQVPGIV